MFYVRVKNAKVDSSLNIFFQRESWNIYRLWQFIIIIIII